MNSFQPQMNIPDPDNQPPPGGTRRFIVLAGIVTIVLAATAFALFYAMMKTSRANYQGPAKLVYPEHRYYR